MEVVDHLIDVWEDLCEHYRIDQPNDTERGELGHWEGSDAMTPGRPGPVLELDSVVEVLVEERLLLVVQEGLVASIRVVAGRASVMRDADHALFSDLGGRRESETRRKLELDAGNILLNRRVTEGCRRPARRICFQIAR